MSDATALSYGKRLVVYVPLRVEIELEGTVETFVTNVVGLCISTLLCRWDFLIREQVARLLRAKVAWVPEYSSMSLQRHLSPSG